MTPSTTKDRLLRLAALAFWLLVWQGASVSVGQEILLVSPARVMREAARLCVTEDFWLCVGGSFGRIACGFFLAQALGVLLAALACASRAVEILLSPLVTVIKSTPVASFTVLALIWIRSAHLSVLISALMAFPIVYRNLCEGIRAADGELLEMASVFRVKGLWVLYIYLPAAAPYFLSAASLSAGLCWKAGIAAEVIGLPVRSIGGALYEAKLYFDTPVLFAWTLVIVLISVVFERVLLALAAALRRRVEGR